MNKQEFKQVYQVARSENFYALDKGDRSVVIKVLRDRSAPDKSYMSNRLNCKFAKRNAEGKFDLLGSLFAQ